MVYHDDNDPKTTNRDEVGQNVKTGDREEG